MPRAGLWSTGRARAPQAGAKKSSSIRKTADLKGRSVAVDEGSTAEYQLIAALAEAGLTLEDVKLKLLGPTDAMAAFNSGKVDAWASYDPYTSLVLLHSDARVVVNGDGITDGLNYMVAAPSALADKRKSKALADYLKRVIRAQDWVFKHPAQWVETWSKETGLPKDAADYSVKSPSAAVCMSLWTNGPSLRSGRSSTPSPSSC